MKNIVNILIGILVILSLTTSCNKDNTFNRNDNIVNLRNGDYQEPSSNEPEYEYLGKSLYEYEKNYQSIMPPEKFFLSEDYRTEFRMKFDSVMEFYQGYTYEAMLSDFVLKGYISEELKGYKLSLYSDLDNGVGDVISYLENKFLDVENNNLSQDEKYSFKTEIKGLEYSYIY